jgi:hypothetical protein
VQLLLLLHDYLCLMTIYVLHDGLRCWRLRVSGKPVRNQVSICKYIKTAEQLQRKEMCILAAAADVGCAGQAR